MLATIPRDMEDVEIIVQEEDTEPITQPIVKPILTKRFAHHTSDDKQELPRTVFEFKFLKELMNQDHAIRNISIVGHLLHGKTTFLDNLIEKTHIDFETNPEKPVKFTDTLLAEQERGISIKSSPVSIVYQSLRSKSYLLNIMDTPGHVNFSDEVTAAIRLSDGIVLMVDAADGLMMNAERLLHHAIKEGMSVTLCINKIDRLILELRLPPSDAYHKLKRIVDEVNLIIDDEDKLVSPLKGNVCFASSQYSICFTLRSFAKLYLERTKSKSITYKQFASKLWGNLYLDGETSKFVPQPPTKSSKRSFVEFILEPLYKLVRIVVEDPVDQFLELAAKYRIKLTNQQKTLNARPLLKIACSQMFGTFESFVDMVVDTIPSPKYCAPSKCPQIWTGPTNCELSKAIRECDPKGPLVVHITKQYPSPDGSSFNVFGLVLSGTIKVDSDVRVLGESYSTPDDEDSRILPVGRLWICNSRYNVEVRSVPAGNWVLIEGVDQPIVKTATILDIDHQDELFTFRPLRFNTKSVIKIAVEPVNPSELPKMLEGLRKCNKSYPLLQTRVEESGEHVMIGTGELYLDCVMHDLRHMYSEIDIRISDPCVSFSETVIEMSKEKCVGETPNRMNEISMIAEPLDRHLDVDLEEERITMQDDQQYIDKFFKRRYKWDDLACRSIWAFGPETNSTNILLNDTLPYEVDPKLLDQIKAPIVQAFHWTTREGPLCEEPIRSVKFKLQHAKIAAEPMYRGGGQIIPTARKVSFLSFLLAEPRLMEPYLFVEIIAPPDVVNSTSESKRSILEDLIVEKRRGKITKKMEIPGTPLRKVYATMPAIDSFGFETDLRMRTTGQAICMTAFEEWRIVPGNPLDRSVDQYLTPLEPQHISHLAREFLLKTRRRKGLSEDVNIEKFMMKN
uniref:U5 small nuclear ribonucleoprotein component n=2 Tax=Aceria tosichella TaxID=561515 RepID=A0A6G1S444_9ACAR